MALIIEVLAIVFLEVVVVIEVSAIVLVAVAPHRIKPNRLMLQRQWL